MMSKSEMKLQLRASPARNVRAIVSGEFRGVVTSDREMELAKEELKNRGLAVKVKKRIKNDDWPFGGLG